MARIRHAFVARAAADTPTDIQQVIDRGTVGEVDFKAERLVDFSLVDELEASVYQEWILPVVGNNIRLSIEPPRHSLDALVSDDCARSTR